MKIKERDEERTKTTQSGEGDKSYRDMMQQKQPGRRIIIIIFFFFQRRVK